MLPDDVFLRVFDFCHVDESLYEWWHTLVHVCRRWRQLILASPRRLNLHLLCTFRRPVKKKLTCWPAIPIAICGDESIFLKQDNLFAALEHRNRVRSVALGLTSPLLTKVAVMMQRPFPALIRLRLALLPSPYSSVPISSVPILPDGFLGGSASCLQEIRLTGIPFPALPTLLLSASDLVDLHLCNIISPTSISPEAIVTGLTATIRLKDLSIEFHPASFPYQRVVTPLTRAVLPALTRFRFLGDYKYLEDLVGQLDCPRLKSIIVSYSNQFIDAHVSQLFQFIDRAEDLKLAQFRRAQVHFWCRIISIGLDSSQAAPHPSHISLKFLHPWSNLQVRSMRQLIQSSAIFTTVRHLSIYVVYREQCDVDNAEWPELFHLFPAVETLRVGGELVLLIDPVLDDLTKEMVVKVFPALRFLNLDGRPTRSVQRFIAARRLSGCPVTIVKTLEEFERLEACSETEDVR